MAFIRNILIIGMLACAILQAFPKEFHEYAALKILLGRYPECGQRIREGASYSLVKMNDSDKYHCYDALTMCPALEGKYCPKILECPAWAEGQVHFSISKSKKGCEQAYELALSAFYYMESQDPLRRIVGLENPCREEFENEVKSNYAKIYNGSYTTQACCGFLNPEKCKFDSNEMKRVIGVASGEVIKSYNQYPFDTSNEGNEGCFYNSSICNIKNETCEYQECVLKKGCAFQNPPCAEGYICISKNNTCVKAEGCKKNLPPCTENYSCVNNTCVLKSGCAYENPLCNESYACFDNKCIKKVGCLYDNPKCPANEECVENKCEKKKGCSNNNPSCSSTQDCVNNTCVLKKGCNYGNPSCPSGSKCSSNVCVKTASDSSGKLCPLSAMAFLAILLYAKFK